jgi:hypothetical protein
LSSATSARIASAFRAKSDEAGSVLEWRGMAFGNLMVRRNRRDGFRQWCHCPGA